MRHNKTEYRSRRSMPQEKKPDRKIRLFNQTIAGAVLVIAVLSVRAIGNGTSEVFITNIKKSLYTSIDIKMVADDIYGKVKGLIKSEEKDENKDVDNKQTEEATPSASPDTSVEN